jgi:hypothetical protein
LGNSVDPLGDVLMKLFPDGFIVPPPPTAPLGAEAELRTAELPDAERDMTAPLCFCAAIASCGHAPEKANATNGAIIAIFMISSPTISWIIGRLIGDGLVRSRTIFHRKVPTM